MSVPQSDIVAVLHSVFGKLSRQMRDMDLPFGLTPERLNTLASIEAHGPISIKMLAAMEKVRSATMSKMISSLEEDGLVKRQADKTDKRGVLVSTTDKGRRLYLRANQHCLNQLGDALAKLEPEQLGMLRELASALEQLTSALDAE